MLRDEFCAWSPMLDAWAWGQPYIPHSLGRKTPGAFWLRWLPHHLPKANAEPAAEERVITLLIEHDE